MLETHPLNPFSETVHSKKLTEIEMALGCHEFKAENYKARVIFDDGSFFRECQAKNLRASVTDQPIANGRYVSLRLLSSIESSKFLLDSVMYANNLRNYIKGAGDGINPRYCKNKTEVLVWRFQKPSDVERGVTCIALFNSDHDTVLVFGTNSEGFIDCHLATTTVSGFFAYINSFPNLLAHVDTSQPFSDDCTHQGQELLSYFEKEYSAKESPYKHTPHLSYL